MMRLFEGKEGWLVGLKDAWVTVDGITENIAGLRVLNWNKSELDSDKQGDKAEISLNGDAIWSDQLTGGSYSPTQIYHTDIQLSP